MMLPLASDRLAMKSYRLRCGKPSPDDCVSVHKESQQRRKSEQYGERFCLVSACPDPPAPQYNAWMSCCHQEADPLLCRAATLVPAATKEVVAGAKHVYLLTCNQNRLHFKDHVSGFIVGLSHRNLRYAAPVACVQSSGVGMVQLALPIEVVDMLSLVRKAVAERHDAGAAVAGKRGRKMRVYLVCHRLTWNTMAAAVVDTDSRKVHTCNPVKRQPRRKVGGPGDGAEGAAAAPLPLPGLAAEAGEGEGNGDDNDDDPDEPDALRAFLEDHFGFRTRNHTQ